MGRLIGLLMLAASVCLSPPILSSLLGRVDGFSIRGALILWVAVGLLFLIGFGMALPQKGRGGTLANRARQCVMGLFALFIPFVLFVGAEFTAYLAFKHLDAARLLVEFHDHSVYEDKELLAPVQTDGSPWRSLGFRKMEGFRVYAPVEAPGMVINQDGFRSPPLGSVPEGEIAVALLGGSTVWGSWVSDENTLAAQVQKILSEQLGQPVTVFNLGIEGNTFGTEIQVLRWAAERQSFDLALFYHGGNDFSGGGGAVAKKSEGSGLGPWLRQFDLYRMTEAILLRMEQAETVVDPKRQDKNKAHYTARHRQAKALCADIGVQCLFALQPMIHSKDRLTGSEPAILATYKGYFPGAAESYEATVRMLAELFAEEHVFDVSGALDGTDQAVFADQIHINAAGNAAVARALTEPVLTRLRAGLISKAEGGSAP
ncbi:MAG: GDSL-type esterase/lipase family protein [Magnetovibrionaceae bacterium]